LTPGYIYLAEEFEVFTPQQFLGVSYPLWNEELGRFPTSDAFKLYYYLILYAIGEVFGYKVLQGLALTLPISLSFVSTYVLTRYIFGNPLASLIAGFVYAVNPWVATNPRHLVMRIEYALFPLLFFFIIKYLDTRQYKYIIYSALILGAIYTVRSWILFLLYSSILLLLHTAYKRNTTPLLFLLTHPIALLLAAPRIIPSIYYMLNTPQYTTLVYIPNPITAFEYLTTYTYTYPGADFSLTYIDSTHYLFGIVASVAITVALISKHTKVLYFVVLYVTGFVLSTHPIETDIFFLDRLLRRGYWNAMIAPLAVSVALGYLINQRYGKYIALIVVVVVAISAWPVFTGDMAGYWYPASPSLEYLKAKEMLENTEGLVMWLPYIGDFRATWSAQTGPSEVSAPTGHVEVRGIGAPAIEWRAYYPLLYFNPLNGTNYFQPFDIFHGDLAYIYRLMGIKYIGIVYDRQWSTYAQISGISNERLKATAEKLATQKDIIPLFIGHHLALLEVKNSGSCSVRYPLFCLCDLAELARLLFRFRHNTPAVILPQPGLNITYILKQSYVYTQNMTELLLYVSSHLPTSRIIAPFFIIPGGDPQKTWAKAPFAAYSTSPEFFNYLYRKGVTNWSWQSDYGYGVVYTESAKKFSLEIKAETESLLAIRVLKCTVCGAVEVHVDNRHIFTIDTQDNTTSFTWFLVTTLNQGLHNVEIKPRGLTVLNVVVVIPKKNLEKARTLLANVRGIDHLFNKTEAPGVAFCKKISQTQWLLSVNLTEHPAIVVLPIPYDPLWYAGDKKAIAVYGVVVGFYIDTGRYEVTYYPERLIPITAIIATTTLLLLLPIIVKTVICSFDLKLTNYLLLRKFRLHKNRTLDKRCYKHK